jgi:hypothetical protein
MDYRDSEKKKLIALVGREVEFSRFDLEIKAARQQFDLATDALSNHLEAHGCWQKSEHPKKRVS